MVTVLPGGGKGAVTAVAQAPQLLAAGNTCNLLTITISGGPGSCVPETITCLPACRNFDRDINKWRRRAMQRWTTNATNHHNRDREL